LAGGALGAMVGDSSAKGQKPVKRAVDAIRDEITSGRAKQRLKDVSERVGERIKSLRSAAGEATTKKSAASKLTDGSASTKKKKKKKAKSAPKTAASKKAGKPAAAAVRKKAKRKS
jgi:hypothetical protein